MSRIEIITILKHFKEKYAAQYGIVLLGIFGSVARDEATASSDVDIVVKTEIPDPFTLVHMKEELEKQLRQHVDIVRLRDMMNPYLKKRIEAEAMYV